MRSLLKLAAAAALVAAGWLASRTGIAPPAQADPRQNPTADYSAEWVMNLTEDVPWRMAWFTKLTFRTRIWYTKDRARLENSFGLSARYATIMDRPAKTRTHLTLIPPSKVYYQHPWAGEAEASWNAIEGGTWEIAKAGDEKVGGVATTKWSVTGRNRVGTTFAGSIWITKENIQVRMEGVSEAEGKKLKLRIELINLKIGPVDPKIFEIPKDLERYESVPKVGKD